MRYLAHLSDNSTDLPASVNSLMQLVSTIKKFIKAPLSFFVDHTLLLLAILFTLGSSLILWHLNNLADSQLRIASITNSQAFAETLSEFRTLYTSEVVVAAKKYGLEVTHDYQNKVNSIPLPATLSMLLGNRLGSQSGGVKSKLYSDYPFPWRKTSGGLADTFAIDAWQALQNNSDKPFYRFEEIGGHLSLRYAVADLMRESCVECHNNHPDTLKNDWKIGDLRGILEIVTPIDTHILATNHMLQQTTYMLMMMMLIFLAIIGIVMRRLRIRSIEAREYAKATRKVNQQLANEMNIRRQAEQELRHLTYSDALTEIANRRKFDEEFNNEWFRALRSQSSLAVILIDIDNFKAYNDNYGHLAGDQALRKVAEILNTTVMRSSDTVARFGGEEFVLLLPEAEMSGALAVAEQVRCEIEKHLIPHEFSDVCGFITISAGVAVMIPSENANQNELINQADKALYYAKHSGRNCIKASEEPGFSQFEEK